MFKLFSKIFGQTSKESDARSPINDTPTVDDLGEQKKQINEAIERGQFETAANLLQSVIDVEKENVDLYVNLSFCLLQLGKLNEAESYLYQALNQDPRHLDAHFMLASVLTNQGKRDDAIKEYESVIQINPSFPYAYKELAQLHIRQQQLDQAITIVDKGLTAVSTFADLHFLRAELHVLRHQFQAAISAYQATIALSPQFAPGYVQLALAFENNGQLNEAIQTLQSLSRQQTVDVNTLLHLGRLHLSNNQIAAALEQFEKVLVLDPQSIEGLANSGNMLLNLGKEQQALARFDAALALNPQLAPLWHSKGTIAYNHEDYAASLEFVLRASQLSPNDADIHHHLGLAYTELGQYQEAIEQYELAIKLKPQHPFAYFDLGKTRLRLEQYDQAIKDLTHSLTINPNLPEANLEIGFAYLATGDLERGFRQYEWRWRCAPLNEKIRPFSAPQWLGQQDIRGKTILLYAEQGLGDMIQLIRYVTEVANLGARVIVEVHPPLIRLFEGFPGIAEIYKGGDILPHFDLRAPIMSLPHLFKTRLDSIPFKSTYFDHDKLQQRAKNRWSEEIKPSDKKKIGVTWAGNRDFMHDKKRSIPFNVFSEIFSEDANFYCLQKELGEQDLEQLKAFPDIHFLGPKLSDMLETAALIAQLDLVITVDTSVAHLAGAMGKEVWIMLPCNPDWRWLLKRSDSPWYAHARLFRQTSIYDWTGVVTEIKHSLSSLLAQEN